MTLEEYFAALRGKRIAVVGLGVSNLPLVRLLRRYGCGVTACDKRSMEALGAAGEELLSLGCEMRLGEEYLSDTRFDVVFRTPGMHPNALAAFREQGAVITSEMEAFFALCPCRTVAITGSDGKTTTSTIIAELLREAGYRVWLGGNIGTPLLDKVPGMESGDIAVLELSSFQLMDMCRSPERAVITNLAPNHLDIHKDMAEYVSAKQNIYRFQDRDGILILNADNALTAGLHGNGDTRFFSRKQETNCVWLSGGIIWRRGEPVLNTGDILLPGVHNIENYMAAIAAVEGIASDEAVRQVAKNFGGVEHRIELVRVKDGVRFYNDSIASSPSRTIAGLRSFPEKVILIAGGYDKHIPYDVLGPEICQHVKKLFLGGATGEKIRKAVEAAPEYRPGETEITDCGGFEAAVRAAAAAAEPGDVVLMSPASAAFDQFKNFMVRGDFYKKLIKEL